MGKVTGLGHVGIFVKDMDLMRDFYTKTLGLTVTDKGPRIVFLSADPASEHHEIALALNAEQRTRASKVSFAVSTLKDLKDLRDRVRESSCTIDAALSRGISLGFSFKDPEGNNIEIYWPTGIDFPQPYAAPINLDDSEGELMSGLDELDARESRFVHLYGRDAAKRLNDGSAA